MKILRIITQTLFLCCGITFLGAMDTASNASADTIAHTMNDGMTTRVEILSDGTQVVYFEGLTQQEYNNITDGRAPENDGNVDDYSEQQYEPSINRSFLITRLLQLEAEQLILEMSLLNLNQKPLTEEECFQAAANDVIINRLKQQIDQLRAGLA